MNLIKLSVVVMYFCAFSCTKFGIFDSSFYVSIYIYIFFLQWPRLGQLTFSSTLEKNTTLKPDKEFDVKQLHLHKPLESTWPKVNKQFLSPTTKPSDPSFTPLQRELLSIMNAYKDLFYPERNALTNGEEIRHAYCLHALNHVLKANAQVLSNNAKKRDQKPGTDSDDYRDQGLTRPKVRELHRRGSPAHPTFSVRLCKCPAALLRDGFLGMCLSAALGHAWESSAGQIPREKQREQVSASLFLCPLQSEELDSNKTQRGVGKREKCV